MGRGGRGLIDRFHPGQYEDTGELIAQDLVMPHEVAMGIDVFRGGLPGQSPMTGFLGLLQSRHKVFVSYHHSNDQPYRDYFERLFTVAHNVMISMSVQATAHAIYVAFGSKG